MGLHMVNWRSNTIQKTIYLLHGLTGDSFVWARFHNLERLMEGRRALVVMPDADRSFYANDPRPGGLPYEDYVSSEIRTYVERVLPAIPARGARACVGLSMGGYGALSMALLHPDLYCAAASISGSTYYGHDMTGRHEADDVGALGRALPKDKNDLFLLAERHARGGPALALRVSCGTEDHLHDTNVAFHEHLARVGVSHEWVEHAGAHNHGTWDAQLPLALAWALDRVGAPAES
jgi:putative tributyrin esterase